MPYLAPPLPVLATALVLVVTMIQPAGAFLIGSCKAFVPDVATDGATPKYDRCFPDCLSSLSVKHDSAKATIIDFYEPGFMGDVYVAVIENDSRLEGDNAFVGSPHQLGTLDGTSTPQLERWYLPFTGLKPCHYYALITYSPNGDGRQVFERTCFLTSPHPEDGKNARCWKPGTYTMR